MMTTTMTPLPSTRSEALRPARSEGAQAGSLPTSQSSDEAVFAYFAQTGCEESFQIIFRRYERRICNFLLKRIGDEALAEDLTQNIFVRILRNAQKFDPKRDFSTWCFTIVHNVLKNHYRSLGRSRMDHFSDLAAPRASGSAKSANPVFDARCPNVTPEEDTYREQLKVQFAQALAQLDPSIRDPFVLNQIEGLSYPEISASLALPVSTVKSRTNRARTQLRQVLAAFGAE